MAGEAGEEEGGRGFRLATSRPHESFSVSGASFLGREASDEVARG